MQTTADSFVNFAGTLVKRQHQPGQKYVQLLFKTADGLKLSLTRNANTVRILKEGESYNISGREKIKDGKSYIDEPTVRRIETTRSRFASKKVIIIGAVVLALVLALILFFALSNNSHPETKKSSSKALGASTEKTEDTILVTPTDVPTSEADAAQQPSQATTPTVPTPKKVTSSSNTTQNNTPAAETPQTTPVVTPPADTPTEPDPEVTDPATEPPDTTPPPADDPVTPAT
jgi:cytoskeletal protein RodZ